MADNTINHYTNPRYIDIEFPVEVTSIKLGSVAGSTTTGSIRIANLVTGDYHGYPYEQHTVNFEDLTVGQSYATPLVINGGSYFAIGRSPTAINATESETPKVEVQAQFAGSGAYLQSTSGMAVMNYKSNRPILARQAIRLPHPLHTTRRLITNPHLTLEAA